MTSNEVAILLFPLLAALFIGGMVWIVTANTVSKSRARQALRAARTAPLSPDDLDPKTAIRAGIGALTRAAERL